MTFNQTNKYICLDRDGTIIEHIHHLVLVSQVSFIPGVMEGCKLLKAANFRFGIFTNQSVIGRGKASRQVVDSINDYVKKEFLQNEIDIDFVYLCPHRPEDKCACRKPLTGMGHDALRKFPINFVESFMIGDSYSDIEFGNNLKMSTVLISNSHYTEATINCGDFLSAAKLILDRERSRNVSG
jgi:histidinol-phosphate phosphatase family protein